MPTDINVESLHQKRLNAILYSNPFGDQFRLTSSTFNDLYDLVTGVDKVQQRSWQFSTAQRKRVHPIYKLQIALKIREEDSNWYFKFRPQHTVYDEHCMILQKRAFRVNTNDRTANCRLAYSSATEVSSADEIDVHLFNPRNPGHILVHELAFGPDSDASVRGVALWFNLDEKDIVACTPQQAKRYRLKKHGKKKVEVVASKFDSGLIDSVLMVRPHDKPAFDLVTSLLQHRLFCLQCDLMCNFQKKSWFQRELQRKKDELKCNFTAQRRHWMAWAWPVDSQRDNVDANTPVPLVDGPYHLSDSKTHAYRIWNSFVSTVPLWTDEEERNREIGENPSVRSCSTAARSLCSLSQLQQSPLDVEPVTRYHQQNLPFHSRRLPVFEQLAQGLSFKPELSEDLPHILSSRVSPNPPKDSNNDRCWKALLLDSEEDSEWIIVRTHFENSRSKKVLSIIQQ